nr:MFS transporter [Azospirillum baldaniorum]
MNAIALNGWLGANRFLVVFAMLAVLMGTSVGVAKITTALYAIALGANAEQLGLLVAGQVAGTLVMSIPIGFLVDHYGPRRLFVLGSALAGVTYALIPAVAAPAFLLGCTTAISFFMPLRFVSLNTVFFEQIRRMGAGKAGWYRGTHLAGQFLIGPGIAVALIHALGYAGTWWVLAASFALTIAVSPVVLRDFARRPSGNAEPPSLRRAGGDLLALLRDRELRSICVIDIAVESAFTYQTAFVVAIALQVFHLGGGRSLGLRHRHRPVLHHHLAADWEPRGATGAARLLPDRLLADRRRPAAAGQRLRSGVDVAGNRAFGDRAWARADGDVVARGADRRTAGAGQGVWPDPDDLPHRRHPGRPARRLGGGAAGAASGVLPVRAGLPGASGRPVAAGAVRR